MTMTEKTAREGATSQTAKPKDVQPIATSKDTALHLHLLNNMESTRDHCALWDGDMVEHQHRTLLVATNGDAPLLAEGVYNATICPDCLANFDAHLEAKRVERERKRQLTQQHKEAMKRRNRIEELLLDMTEANRHGRTEEVQQIVAELTRLDDEALAKAGLASWSDYEDEED